MCENSNRLLFNDVKNNPQYKFIQDYTELNRGDIVYIRLIESPKDIFCAVVDAVYPTTLYLKWREHFYYFHDFSKEQYLKTESEDVSTIYALKRLVEAKRFYGNKYLLSIYKKYLYYEPREEFIKAIEETPEDKRGYLGNLFIPQEVASYIQPDTERVEPTPESEQSRIPLSLRNIGKSRKGGKSRKSRRTRKTIKKIRTRQSRKPRR